jgi:hypothetical protein
MKELHTTTMKSGQRKLLVHTLSQFHTMKEVAELTDSELHLQWLVECGYAPKKKAILKF